MKTIEINDMWKYVSAAPACMNVMFVADTGVGKTTEIERGCEKDGYFLKTLILSQLSADEALGIPVRDEREFRGKVYPVLRTAVPEWVFELAEHEKAVLFLDEFLTAQPSVMNSFLNFLTQKKVNGIDLSHVKVVACTNIGSYTFDPDTNMLSRFCWFYVENRTFNNYLKDERIVNNYVDENKKVGTIFEPRSLKPRCQEWLMDISDDYVLDFYEGFTNKQYVMVNRNAKVNDIIAAYFEPAGKFRYSISDENVKNMVALLVKSMPRVQKWDETLKNFVNLDMDTVAKISKELEVTR